MKIKSIKLENIKSFDNLTISDLDRNDLVILVGENGSGKSTIFDVLNLVFSFIVNGGWASYNIGDLLKNEKDYGSIEIEFILNEEEKNEAKLSDNVCNLNIKLDRANSFTIDKQKGVNEVRNNLINKRYNRELFDRDKNIKNFGIYIHRSPYRYEDIQDINEPQRNLLKFEEDKIRVNSKAQIQSSRWQIVLSHLLQLDRIIKAKYFEVNNNNLSSSVAELKNSTDQFKALTDDFNYLLEDKVFDKIEETTTDKTYFWIKNTINKLRIEFKQLSSGEKEALFLFSDIRRQAPNNSIIAVDEPDLHLHYNLQKKLIERFADIGKDNQIFLATHSLAVVRNAEKIKNSVVLCFNNNIQPKLIKNRADFLELYKILADDLANVLTNEVIIFVEGEDEEKDAKIFSFLFDNPKINFIPTKDRANVNKAVWLALHLVAKQVSPQKLFAITDGDGRNKEEKEDWENKFNKLVLVLEKYSIENYFCDFELWEKIEKTERKEISKEYMEANFLDFVKNKLNTEENIEKATEKILKSRSALGCDKGKNPNELKNEIKIKLTTSINDKTFVNLFPVKEFLGEIINDLFILSLDDFRNLIIKLMKDNNKIPLEISNFINSKK